MNDAGGGTDPAPRAAGCPVCLHPGRGEARCPACTFRLAGDPVLGAPTGADRAALAAEFDAAAYAWDSAAARRARGGPRDDAAIAAVVRGRGPAPGGPDGPEPLDGESPGLGELLRKLVAGELREVLFVELGVRRIAAVRARAGAAGLPRAESHAEALWTDLVPALDPDGAVCRFQLAGGVGTAKPVDRPEFDEAVRHWLRTALPGACRRPGSAPVALLLGGARWVLLDRAADVVRETCSVGVETRAAPPAAGESAAARARAVLRTAPLRAPHTLLLAGAGPAADSHVPVTLEHRVLFEAGLRLSPGETRTVTVTVHGGPPAAADPAGPLPVVLPLLAGRYGPGQPGAALIGLAHTELPALGSRELTFVLRGPGEIEVYAGGSALPTAPGVRDADLDELTRRVPTRLRRPKPLELICAVEMSGPDAAEIAERVRFTDELIRTLEERPGAGGGVRVGVIGYYHHDPRNAHQPVRRHTLSMAPAAPRLARRYLRRLRQEIRPREGLTSSLEDALHNATVLTAQGPGRPVGRVLLLIGRRPPAPPVQQGLMPACPRGLDWREQLRVLHRRDVRVAVRADPPAPEAGGTAGRAQVHQYISRSWHELTGGDRHRFLPGTDSAEHVALALAAEPARGPDAGPLAFTAPPLPER
ncbi:hypothetical protein [Streptomyces smaragdinus]|uniref:hypothetical protein n=1 Tax=Streptomyces smaragdinus TaxID=2585196 RepID=UPI00188673E2|nr:hypothetical protein [Streptomyces smaragdinus]